MIKKILWLTWALSLGLLLAGCASSPRNNFYLLSAHEFPTPVGTTPTLGVGPIETPEYLNRKNMVQNRSGTTLQVADVDLWAEPLADGIQRVLVLNLAGLLNTQAVSSFPWHPKRAPDYAVKVNLLQLEVGEQQALLTAEWLVYRPANAESVQRSISRLHAPLPPDTATPEQVATAYSALMLQLSETIAASIAADTAKVGTATAH